ncbi:hypothetical protein PRECH8_23520 [Insulibacter thermoxylanivorax]|uniref:Uncharacterized protein n=1 Tax=Insulibacter thermoxylanivorax TaxID=2749268 RepID=A0A916QE29_9BACL|nr:hypothetical protein [Insulibacter thermoxylanivorax]GFR39056.1 hypothetical protein PRECH8_23520 [Insulibacter thermoxylanivorax]
MEMGAKTPFHDTAQQFIQTIDGSRRVFSSLVDFFSAMAAQDYANDWAPEWAARCFKFNKAQKKFQRDFQEWVDSITEDDVKLVLRLFGSAGEPVRLRQGGWQLSGLQQNGLQQSGLKQGGVSSSESKAKCNVST